MKMEIYVRQYLQVVVVDLLCVAPNAVKDATYNQHVGMLLFIFFKVVILNGSSPMKTRSKLNLII